MKFFQAQKNKRRFLITLGVFLAYTLTAQETHTSDGGRVNREVLWEDMIFQLPQNFTKCRKCKEFRKLNISYRKAISYNYQNTKFLAAVLKRDSRPIYTKDIQIWNIISEITEHNLMKQFSSELSGLKTLNGHKYFFVELRKKDTLGAIYVGEFDGRLLLLMFQIPTLLSPLDTPLTFIDHTIQSITFKPSVELDNTLPRLVLK